VGEFRRICDEKLGIKLDGRETLEAATRVFQISYLRQYGLTGEKRRQELARLFGQNTKADHGDCPK